jgi:DHA2 family methylenomycin A resistance protein-like MFS transporter
MSLGFGVVQLDVTIVNTPTATILTAARAVQGISVVMLVPNSLALFNHAYPETTERGRVVGW